jgi:hypothetical protein
MEALQVTQYYETSPEAMAQARVVQPGFFWVSVPSVDFDAVAKKNRKIPATERPWFVRKTAQVDGQTFAVLQILRPVTEPFRDRMNYFAASMTDAELRAIDPRELGVWEQESPSWIHTAAEMADEISESAKEVAASVGSGLKTAVWFVGGSLLLAGLVYAWGHSTRG